MTTDADRLPTADYMRDLVKHVTETLRVPPTIPPASLLPFHTGGPLFAGSVPPMMLSDYVIPRAGHEALAASIVPSHRQQVVNVNCSEILGPVNARLRARSVELRWAIEDRFEHDLLDVLATPLPCSGPPGYDRAMLRLADDDPRKMKRARRWLRERGY